MKKAILLAGQDSDCDKYISEVRGLKEHLEQRMTFLQKQAQQAKSEFEASMRIPWDDLRDRLKAMGKIPPDFEDREMMLHWDDGSGVLFLEEKCCEEHDGFMGFIKRLFEKS